MRRSEFCSEELETNAEEEKEKEEMRKALDARGSSSCEDARTTRAEVRHEGIARHGTARVAA